MRIALLALSLVATLAHAAPPLPPTQAGCTRTFSGEYTDKVERPTSNAPSGSCAKARADEEQRQLTQSELGCLMNGYEASTDLRVACTRVNKRTAKGTEPVLAIQVKWRCYRTTCK